MAHILPCSHLLITTATFILLCTPRHRQWPFSAALTWALHFHQWRHFRGLDRAQIGDSLMLGNGETTTVTKFFMVQNIGLYNSQTLDGNDVVEGVVATTLMVAVKRVPHAPSDPVGKVY